MSRNEKVREMRTAETILNIIQDRGKRQLPLDDVYRQLSNPGAPQQSEPYPYLSRMGTEGLSQRSATLPEAERQREQ